MSANIQRFTDTPQLLHRESVDYGVAVDLARAEDSAVARELRMVRSVRIELRLHCDAGTVAGIKLETRLVVEDLHESS